MGTEEDFPGAKDNEIRRGSILVRKVSFGYGEQGAGEKVTFVGRSGEGKSTLIQLLCRLYESWEGGIYVEDVRLTDYTLSSLRQKQRIAIARCIYRKLKILLLDEAASALDYQNESGILNLLLQERTAGKTFVMVTHRGTSVAKCNRVIV